MQIAAEAGHDLEERPFPLEDSGQLLGGDTARARWKRGGARGDTGAQRVLKASGALVTTRRSISSQRDDGHYCVALPGEGDWVQSQAPMGQPDQPDPLRWAAAAGGPAQGDGGSGMGGSGPSPENK